MECVGPHIPSVSRRLACVMTLVNRIGDAGRPFLRTGMDRVLPRRHAAKAEPALKVKGTRLWVCVSLPDCGGGGLASHGDGVGGSSSDP